MAQILAGAEIAENIQKEITDAVEKISTQHGLVPTLCAIQVGDDCQSALYLELQEKISKKLSVGYVVKKLPREAKEKDLYRLINELNNEKLINGIILQQPLPKHLAVSRIRTYLDIYKDIEGVHPENLGRIITKEELFVPCTACAVMELLKQTKIDLYGKEAVVVGHSEIVGKPIALMLLNALSTVSVCHIATSERGRLQAYVENAEILVVAVGKPNIIKGQWIKEQAVVIDVGINCIDGRVIGDVEFDKAQERASFITPVPGGVGPVTVAFLMSNLIKATKLQLGEG